MSERPAGGQGHQRCKVDNQTQHHVQQHVPVVAEYKCQGGEEEQGDHLDVEISFLADFQKFKGDTSHQQIDKRIDQVGSESVQGQQCHDGGNDENRQQVVEPGRMFADGSFDLPVADGNDPEAGYDHHGIENLVQKDNREKETEADQKKSSALMLVGCLIGVICHRVPVSPVLWCSVPPPVTAAECLNRVLIRKPYWPR